MRRHVAYILGSLGLSLILLSMWAAGSLTPASSDALMQAMATAVGALAVVARGRTWRILAAIALVPVQATLVLMAPDPDDGIGALLGIVLVIAAAAPRRRVVSPSGLPDITEA